MIAHFAQALPFCPNDHSVSLLVSVCAFLSVFGPCQSLAAQLGGSSEPPAQSAPSVASTPSDLGAQSEHRPGLLDLHIIIHTASRLKEVTSRALAVSTMAQQGVR